MPGEDDHHGNFEKVLRIWENRAGESPKTLRRHSPTTRLQTSVPTSKNTSSNRSQNERSETKEDSAEIIKASESPNEIKYLATAEVKPEGNKIVSKASSSASAKYKENTDYKEQERGIDTRKLVRAIQHEHAGKEGVQTDLIESRTGKLSPGYVQVQTAEIQPDIQPGKSAQKPGERKINDVFHTRINTTADIETRENYIEVNSNKSQRVTAAAMDGVRSQIGNAGGQQKSGVPPRKDIAALAQRLKAKQATASGHARSLAPPSQRPATSSKALPALNRLANKQGGSKIPAKTENVLKHLKTLRKMADEKKAGHVQGNENKVNSENKKPSPVVNLKHDTGVMKPKGEMSADKEKKGGIIQERNTKNTFVKKTANLDNSEYVNNLSNQTSQRSEGENTKEELTNENLDNKTGLTHIKKTGEILDNIPSNISFLAANSNSNDEEISQRVDEEHKKEKISSEEKFREKATIPARTVGKEFANFRSQDNAKTDVPDGVLTNKEENKAVINTAFVENSPTNFSKKFDTSDVEVSDSQVAEWEAELENMNNFCSSVQKEFREMTLKLQNLGSEIRILNWQRRAQMACETVSG